MSLLPSSDIHGRTSPAPRELVMNRKRKRLSDRWLDYCDRVAFKLLDERQIPPGRRGLALLLTAVSKRVGGFFYPQWLSDTWKRRKHKKNVEVDARGVSKFMEFLESIATGLSYNLQAIGGWCYRLVVPEKLIKSTERIVVEKSVNTFWDLRYWGKKLAKRFVPQWLRTRLSGVATGLSSGYAFCVAWAKSREWKKLLWAVPAVLLALPLVGAVAATLVYSPSQKIRHYQRALADAVESRDEQAEQVYFQKLAQLGFGQMDRAEFHAAYLLSAEEGKWDEAVERMRKLAPLTEPRYADAHLWIADNLLRGRIDSTDRWDEIEQHASHALALATSRNRTSRDNARLLLARAKGRRGDVETALAEMDELSQSMPTLHFELMQQAISTRQMQIAKRHARKVVSICEDLEADATAADRSYLTPYHFQAWTTAKQILDGPDAAVAVLEQAALRFPEDESVCTRLAAAISPPLVSADLADSQTVELLKRVLQLDANNATAASLLTQSAAGSPHLRSVVSSFSEQGVLPAKVCMQIGDACWENADPKGAVWHYEQAAKIDPNNGPAWNNVAWLRGCVDATQDLELALVAADRAIELDDDPRCFETRGQILAKLERWPAAIEDLERAVNGSLPDSGPAHATLARALAAMGDEEAAAAHRRKAELLK